MFNAETFYIGFCAGAMGIGITLLLLIPANSLIRSLADGVNVKASLPPVAALVLVGLSVVSYFAGRSDSVTKSGEERSGDSASNRLKNRDDSFYKKAQKSEKILVPVLFCARNSGQFLCLAGERFCWLESKKKDLWILL